MDIRIAPPSKPMIAKGSAPETVRSGTSEPVVSNDTYEPSNRETSFWDRHVALSSVHSSGGRTISKYRHSDGLRATVAAADMGLIASGSMLAGMPELAQLWGGAPAVVAGGVAVAAGVHLIASLCQMSTDGPIPLVTRPLLRRR